MFRKLNLLVSFIILFCLSITLSHAGKFPAGYPECWQDTKNPIILNIESPNQFCPLNSKLGHYLLNYKKKINIIAQIHENIWNNKKTIQLNIKDLIL